MAPTSLYRVLETALVNDRDMDLGDGLALSHSAQDFLRDLGEQGPGQDVVDVARATLDLAAAAGNAIDQLVAITEDRVMILAHPLGDPAELKLDDLAHHGIGDRIERDHDQAAEKGLLEDLDSTFGLGGQQVGPDRFGQDLRCGGRVGVLAYLENGLRADVRGQQDNRVLEVDLPSLAVFKSALIEDLEEQFEHVGVGLFDLVEEDDAVRPTADGLGQYASLAVADVTRRRTLEARDGVCLLIFRHVDRDQIPLAAVEGIGQGRADSVLPTPLEPTRRNTPIGRLGSVRFAREVRIRWAIASRACDWPMTRSSSLDRRLSTVWISLAIILPTGTPVQPATTSAMVCESTLTCISGASPWSLRSSLVLVSSSVCIAARSAEDWNGCPFPVCLDRSS